MLILLLLSIPVYIDDHAEEISKISEMVFCRDVANSGMNIFAVHFALRGKYDFYTIC